MRLAVGSRVLNLRSKMRFCVLCVFWCAATLVHPDSPYIRGLGFLYLRYVAEPKTLWQWFSPYLDDPEEFTPGGDKTVKK